LCPDDVRQINGLASIVLSCRLSQSL
jgi:hypothetical protein